MSDLDKEELEATRNMGKNADELSEKEIIQHFEFIKSGIKEETKFIDISILEYFEGLLDLYNKEKEKNKRYEKYLKTKEEKYEKILEYIETEIEQDYISKDKVKECLDDIIDYFDNPSIPDEDNQFLEKKKKELLEEEE